jgi:MFS family permease
MLGVYGIVTAADNGWTSPHTVGFEVAALALLAAFIGLEWRLANPLMPLRVLAIRTLVGASTARALLFAGLSTNFFFGALYLQHIHGYSAFQTGLAFLPVTLTLAAMSSGISARLMARVGPRNLLMAGLGIIVIAMALLSNVSAGASYAPQLLVAFVLLGIGAGSSFLPLLTISMSEVPIADAGLGSGFSNVTMQVGGAVGLASVTTIATSHANGIASFQMAYVLAAVIVAAALTVVVVGLRARAVAAPQHEAAPAAAEEAA